MKPIRTALLAVATLGVASAQTTPAPTPASPPPPAEAPTFQDALTKGKVSLAARLRYEHVAQDNALEDADAITLMARLGYTTLPFQGIQASVEFEHVADLLDDYYDGTGAPNGYSTVADPNVTNLNQAWLSYTYGQTKATVGRQRLVLDNARFVGDVGWRQNNQTFDAVVLQDKTFDRLTLTYAYLDGVNRVFDDSGAQPDFKSDSHVFNVSYSGLPFGTLTGYAYLLDFDNSAPNSSATYGVSLAGSAKLNDDVSLLYRAEFATQSDYADNPVSYDANYYLLEVGPKFRGHSVSVGYEVLESDNGAFAFRTPLATLHAHNGWSDQFLVTPGTGLTDLYLKATAALPHGINFLGFYHKFEAEAGGADYGDEIDLQLSYKVNNYVTVLAKAAFYNADGFGVDTEKFWLQADFTY